MRLKPLCLCDSVVKTEFSLKLTPMRMCGMASLYLRFHAGSVVKTVFSLNAVCRFRICIPS